MSTADELNADDESNARTVDVGGTGSAEPDAGATRYEPATSTPEQAHEPQAAEQQVQAADAGSPQAGDEQLRPLDAAAAQGPMTWPEDPVLDPPGAPEPLFTTTSDVDKPIYIGVPGGSAGGH